MNDPVMGCFPLAESSAAPTVDTERIQVCTRRGCTIGEMMSEHNVVSIDEALLRRANSAGRPVSRRRSTALSRSRIAADAALFNAASVLEATLGEPALVSSRSYPRKRLG